MDSREPPEDDDEEFDYSDMELVKDYLHGVQGGIEMEFEMTQSLLDLCTQHGVDVTELVKVYIAELERSAEMRVRIRRAITDLLEQHGIEVRAIHLDAFMQQ